MTHNGIQQGFFTVLSAADGSILFNDTDKSQLLSPPGIFFNPFPGPYPEGKGNGNDLVIFGNRPFPTADTVPDFNSIYVFQFPVGYPNTATELGLVTLLNTSNFQATTAPLIANGGMSMFWGVSRSRVEGWINTDFNRNPGGGGIGYERGDPASKAVLADLAIGADTITPTIYTGNAGVGFGAISTASGKMVGLWNFTTGSPVYAQAKVAPADSDKIVFYIEELGTVYARDAATGKIIWFNETKRIVKGSFAINSASDTIYFADSAGILTAWQVAEFPPPSPPTKAPVAPTIAPIEAATEAPTKTTASSPPAGSSATPGPTAAEATSTAAPTAAGVPTTAAPTSAPTAAPKSGAPLLVPTNFGAFVASLILGLQWFV